MNSSTFATSPLASAISSASKSPASLSAGSVPPKYLSTIATVLETRLPRPFARSEFILFIIISFENELSAPKAISRRMWYLIASAPYLSPRMNGSTTLPKDLDIFCPLNVIQPCTARCLGSGRSSAISIAGQMIAWNLMISFATM